MQVCDTLIRNARVVDGSGAEPELLDVVVSGDRICAIGSRLDYAAGKIVDGAGFVLTPGFIDVHTHDDTNVIRTPEMLPKLSQGVTTVIVGNCGISAAPVRLVGDPPDPMNLLGDASVFQYPTFAAYVAAIDAARPTVNVAALVGHTALRNNHMDRLDRAASPAEIAAMRAQLIEGLECGALGLSTGLAYLSANAATTEEVIALAEPLAGACALYTTHLRSETEGILDAMREAFAIGGKCKVPVVISHLKCAGVDNWGRSGEVLQALESARAKQPVGCDCYPYAAGSSTLAVAAHPGATKSELIRHDFGFAGAILRPQVLAPMLQYQSAAMGALPTLRAATDPTAMPGDYFGPGRFCGFTGNPSRARIGRRATDRYLQERLWTTSENLTGVVYPI